MRRVRAVVRCQLPDRCEVALIAGPAGRLTIHNTQYESVRESVRVSGRINDHKQSVSPREYQPVSHGQPAAIIMAFVRMCYNSAEWMIHDI